MKECKDAKCRNRVNSELKRLRRRVLGRGAVSVAMGGIGGRAVGRMIGKQRVISTPQPDDTREYKPSVRPNKRNPGKNDDNTIVTDTAKSSMGRFHKPDEKIKEPLKYRSIDKSIEDFMLKYGINKYPDPKVPLERYEMTPDGRKKYRSNYDTEQFFEMEREDQLGMPTYIARRGDLYKYGQELFDTAATKFFGGLPKHHPNYNRYTNNRLRTDYHERYLKKLDIDDLIKRSIEKHKYEESKK